MNNFKVNISKGYGGDQIEDIIGYTTGVFDLFHIGHLNIIKRASHNCDYLIVGVTTDELVYQLKGRYPIIPFEERIEIVRSLKLVDEVVPETTSDKMVAWRNLNFDVIFKGDDWKGSEKWNQLEKEFAAVGVKVVYFPYTKHTSSTSLREVIDKILA
jgi:glycerol-3-phosphate cytidylyltransferase